MAKTIKFNLICDGKAVRNLEDLRNNFVIEDILEYYKNGLLTRWLTVRGYNEELEKVKGIKAVGDSSSIRELIKIFNISTDSAEIEKDIYILEYLNEKKRKQDMYRKTAAENSEIVKDYFNGYTRRVKEILDHSDDMTLIKDRLRIIDNDFNLLFQKDCRNLFYTFYKRAPMAIFAMLLRDNMKKRLIPAENEEKMSDDKKKMYTSIQSLLDYSNLKPILGDNLLEFSGDTRPYWKIVEPAGKEFMILSMGARKNIKSYGGNKEYDQAGVNYRFIKLNGIEYQSDSATDQLLYMEV